MNGLDEKGGSAIHWACFMGCENSVNFLTAWGVELNKRDDEGYTPLHLAVISGNTRVVKRMLLMGANPDIRDNNDKKPADLAVENNYKNIHKMLKETSIFALYFNIKPVFRPTKRCWKQIIYFHVLFILTNACLIYLIFPNI